MSVEMEQFFEDWNKMGAPFATINHTKNRDNAIRLRLADPWWAEHYAEALEHVKKSPFCRGKNDRHWVCTISFFMRPDSVARLIEGEFDNTRGRPVERDLTPEELHAAGVKRVNIQRQQEEQFAREYHDRGETCSYAWCERCGGKKGAGE